MSLKDQSVGTFWTPDDMATLQQYIEKFNGSERVIANVCAFMAWNLACRIAQEEHNAKEDDPSLYPLIPTCCMCGSEAMDWRLNTKKEEP